METTVENLMNNLVLYFRSEEEFDNNSITEWFDKECPDVVWEWTEDQIRVLRFRKKPQ